MAAVFIITTGSTSVYPGKPCGATNASSPSPEQFIIWFSKLFVNRYFNLYIMVK